ncbi:uncharacterized protein LOC134208892 [Armigeres subalbatus]|uniref:uncharacterized protein LOC134208892 n=1 Tax=Armigeres subalbatus TaxID=124917 RepID=UPI002ED28523
MSLLRYSKTWPSILTKMAIVQLRVDSNGRTYSSIVEPACLTGPTNLVESNPNFRMMGQPQIVIQTPGETQMVLPDVANVGEIKVSGGSVSGQCKCGIGEAGCEMSLKNEERFRRPYRAESIKIDNWDYIYTEKIPFRTMGSNGASATAEIPCDDHRCITGQAALKASTLRRHYYPEGDWGWVIVFVGMFSIILNHGVQISGPLYLLPAGERFKQSAVNSTGE